MSENVLTPDMMDDDERREYEDSLNLVEAGVLDPGDVSLPQLATEEDLAWLPTEKQD